MYHSYSVVTMILESNTPILVDIFSPRTNRSKKYDQNTWIMIDILKPASLEITLLPSKWPIPRFARVFLRPKRPFGIPCHSEALYGLLEIPAFIALINSCWDTLTTLFQHSRDRSSDRPVFLIPNNIQFPMISISPNM